MVLGELIVDLYVRGLDYVRASLAAARLRDSAAPESSFADNVRRRIAVLLVGGYEAWLGKVEVGETDFECLVPDRKKPLLIEKVFAHEQLLKEATRDVRLCVDLCSRLMKGLVLNWQYTEDGVVSHLCGLHDQKAKVEQTFKKHEEVLYRADGLVVYFLFLKVCRSRKYTLMDGLKRYFDHLALHRVVELKPVSRHLICCVSGQDEFIGAVLSANRLMRETFGLPADRIQHRSFKINEIMPKPVANTHDELMRRFKQTGESRHLGRHVSLLAVRRENITRLETIFKVSASTEGLVFTACLLLPKVAGHYALYDHAGEVTDCSPLVKDSFEGGKVPNILESSKLVRHSTAAMRFCADFPSESQFARIGGMPV